MVVITSEWFGKKIGEVLTRRDLLENDRLVTYIDMFNFTMILSRLRKSNRCYTLLGYSR